MVDVALVAGLDALADTMGLAHEKLDTIVEAITAEPEPSRLEGLLEQILASLTRIEAAQARQ